MNADIRERVADCARRGLTLRQTAQELRICRSTVIKYRRELGIQSRTYLPWASEDAARRRRLVAELTLLGKSAREIAEDLGVTTRTVQRDRKHMQVAKRHTPPLTEEEYARAEQMLNEGCSYAEVARTLKRCKGTIERHFPGRGWTREQVGDYSMMLRKYRELAS